MSIDGRVLVVTPPSTNRGGVAHYYRVLREHLGPEVEYFTRGGGGDETNPAGALRLLRDVRRFARQMKRRDIDLVQLNPSFGYKSLLRDRFFMSSAKRANKPVILFFRGWDPRCERVVRRFLLAWFRSPFFEADLIIVLSRRFERSLREMGFTGPISVETTVVPDFVFDRAPREPEESACAAEPTSKVLFLSRLERDKGVYDVIQTHRILVEAHPGVRLLIAGEGTELARAKELVRTQHIPGVSFLGYVEGDAKDAVYRGADICFFPSSYGEGMPNSVLEAMAYGLPVVTRYVGGLNDFFENERMGYATDSRDAETFAELIGLLIVDAEKRNEMGRFNRAYAEEHFRASRVAERFRGLYGRFL